MSDIYRRPIAPRVPDPPRLPPDPPEDPLDPFGCTVVMFLVALSGALGYYLMVSR